MIRFLSVQRLAVIDQLETRTRPRHERPDRRDGRRQVHPRRSRRPPPRRPGVRRPRAVRRRNGDSPGGPRHALRRGADRQTRSLGTRPEPRLPRRPAGHDRRAAGSGRLADRSARAARAPGAARSDDAARRSSIATPASTAACRARRGASRGWSRRARRSRASRRRGGRVPSGSTCSSSSATRSSKVTPRAGRTTRSRAEKTVVANAEKLARLRERGLRRALRRRPRGDDEPGARSGSGSASSPRSTRASSRSVDARAAVMAPLDDAAPDAARLRRLDRSLARAAPGRSRIGSPRSGA